MKNRILVLALVAFSVNMSAQEIAVSDLTFGDAIKIGLKNNVTLNTQKNQLYAAQARKTQAIANFLPNVNGQAFMQRTDGLQIDPTTGEAANVSADYIQGSASTNLVLFSGFGRINNLLSNRELFAAQSAFVNRSKQDVVFAVASQFLQVLLDQELLTIAEENLNAQKVILEQMKGFVDVGARAPTDQYNQDAQVKNFEVTYLRAKISLENDRALLAQTLQLDPSTTFKVVKPKWENDIAYFKGLSLDSLYQIALDNRADLQQAEHLLESAQYSLRGASSGYSPTISLFAQYGSTYFASNAWEIVNRPDLKPASFNEQFRRQNPSLSYGVALNIPIFDRLVTRTNRVVSRVAYDNAILTRDNLIKTIKIDVQRSFKNYQTAIESYQAGLAQFEAGALALETQRESYRLGIASQVELATANQTYVQAASSRAQAEVTLIFQQMLLDYYLGTLKVESLIEQ